ncbi:MAG TPA: NAD(+) synthase [Paludibacter sp.]|nr:NAD(+) synthase [Paludibacter sp.]
MYNGFIKVAAAIPELKVADCAHNLARMAELIQQGEEKKVQVICFPELGITGYTCADLFLNLHLLENAEKALAELQAISMSVSAIIIAGLPLRIQNQVFNTAAVIQGGRILGIVPKTHLPNQKEFYEKRWFSSGSGIEAQTVDIAGEIVPFGTDLVFSDGVFSFGIEICEDLWLPIPPSGELSIQGAEVIFNLSASNELIGKHAYRLQLIEQQSARCNAGYVYASSGSGESTTDMVYTGNGIIAENGHIVATAERFSFDPQLVVSEIDIERLRADRIRNNNFNNFKSGRTYRVIGVKNTQPTEFELTRTFGKLPFVPSASDREASCNEIFSIQVGGLAKRWLHTRSQTLVLGISGGLDSTLALLVCVKAADKLGIDRKRIIGITMPGFGTTDRTYSNAVNLIHSLGVSFLEIPIKEACLQHFKDIGHDPGLHDITFENTQARERTQILMDVANKHQGIVIGTGDLSEMALGWSTYNGDHMSMYAVNSGVPKTLVRYLVDFASHQVGQDSEAILRDIINTPVSPELLPADHNGDISQKTEHIVGPYELHDFFLYYFLRFGFGPEKILFLAHQAFADVYPIDIIEKWLRVFMKRFFANQFKRSCIPDGPKVGSVNLSPRGDWRMPSDAVSFDF